MEKRDRGEKGQDQFDAWYCLFSPPSCFCVVFFFKLKYEISQVWLGLDSRGQPFFAEHSESTSFFKTYIQHEAP